jgi:BMFP domain-containing protein YqiC
MPRIKREEAKLLAYTVLFNKQGQLITERISTDIKKLKKFLSREEFNLLQSVLRSASTELDAVHNKIEADLNARIT